MGARRDADRPGHRRRDLPRAPRRPRGRRDSRPAAGGRLPDLRPRGARGRRPRSRRRAASPGRAAKADLQGALPAAARRARPSPASAGSTSSTTRPCRPSTVLGPGGDAGVLRVPGTDFGLAVTVDCNNRLVALDPYEGGKAAVAEAARNIACTGARAARHHRLPQLRQPGEARGLLPVPRGLPRHRRRLPGVRHAGHRRQRLASTTRARPAPSIRRRPSAWSGLLEQRRRPGAEPLLARRATRSSSSARTRGAARRLRLLGRGARLRRRRGPRRWISRPSAGCSSCWSPRPGERLLRSAHDCSRGRPGSWRWPRRRSAAPTPPAGSAPTIDLTALRRRASSRRASSTARTARRVVVSVRARRRRRRCWRWPASTACRRIARAGSASRGGALELRLGRSAVHVGHRRAAPDLFRRRFRGGCSIRTWTARRESNGMCGIIGVSGIPDAARLTYLGLYALQHRGPGERRHRRDRPRGQRPLAPRHGARVARTSTSRSWPTLPGDVAVGHTRYSTTGSTVLANAQPCRRQLPLRPARRSRTTATSPTPPSSSASWSRRARSSPPRPTPRCWCT